MRIVLALAIALALVGAASSAERQRDPCTSASRDINIFSLLDNSASGTYDACLDDLRDKLTRLRLRTRLLQGEAARLRAEAGNLEGERAAAAQRLAAANARQAAAFARLEAARESRDVDRAKLRDVLSRAEELAQELDELNRAGRVDSARGQRLKQEQEELFRRIDAMLGQG